MSTWLEHHVRTFVIPGIASLAKYERRRQPGPVNNETAYNFAFDDTNPGSGLTADDIDTTVRLGLKPAKAPRHKEAGLVYAACKSLIDFNRHWNSEKLLVAMKALETCDADKIFLRERTAYFDNREKPGDVIHSIVKHLLDSVEAEARKGHKAIILPGRDVWVFNVLAQKRGLNVVYDPRVSRLLLQDNTALASVVMGWGVDLNNAIVLDTGFAGSIHRAICEISNSTPTSRMLSSRIDSQVFPNHRGSRSRALAIEYTPKYFRTGTVRNHQPVQYLADLPEFIMASALTIWAWHHESPRWIKTSKGGNMTKT